MAFATRKKTSARKRQRIGRANLTSMVPAARRVNGESSLLTEKKSEDHMAKRALILGSGIVWGIF